MPSSDDYHPLSLAAPGRITAVLGPTNTGKTHYALERMLAHRSGMIGLPLRLLAREVYDRVVAQKGEAAVALVTGEEKIIPKAAQYWVATVEAMPLERNVSFMAIDEIQLAADRERGRIFTSRLLHARGMDETLFLGSDTMRPILRRLFENISFVSRERFSTLTYEGSKKVTRLPRRSAVIAFSADTVYATAELVRRQRGGAAVVMGALSPRTRNAQAALYQNGEVDFLIATDAIGMGLNMDIDHVAFAAGRKFDGTGPRDLFAAELAQIAGRAGRHIRPGTFGTTADCAPFDEEIIARIENHEFEPVRALQWRTESIDTSSLPALFRSLERPTPRPELVRSRRNDDEAALQRLANISDIRNLATGGAALATLWDICQIPDFRKLSIDQHVGLLHDLYLRIIRDGGVDDDFVRAQVDPLERTDGGIDAIAARLAHIRSWTYLSHRHQWLQNAAYWQQRTRAIEDKLSDQLHELLTQRFVDRRTTALRKKLNDNEPILAGVSDDGEVIVEGQFVGRLLGFEFIVDPRAETQAAKSLRAAGEKALRPVLATRAAALANAPDADLDLTDDGALRWRSAIVARLRKGPAALRPDININGLDKIPVNMRARVEERLRDFVVNKIDVQLNPIVALDRAVKLTGDNALQGLTSGVAFRLVENFGASSRAQFGDDLKQLDQNERGKLRKLGVRFGEYTVFIPAILKPAPARLLVLLWALWNDRAPGQANAPKPGLVSLEMSDGLPHAYYYAAGYRPSGQRAVRIDMLERLAGLVRNARNSANMREGFEANSQMMSLVGCSGEDFEGIMRSLGFRKHLIKRKPVAAADAAQAEKTPQDPSSPTPAKAEAPEESSTDDKPSQENAGAPSAGNDNETQAADAPEAPTPNDNSEAAATPQNDATSEGDANTSTPIEPDADKIEEPAAETAAAESADTNSADKPDAEASTSDQNAAEPEEIEVTVWRVAPRKHHSNNQNAKNAQKKQGAGPGGDNQRHNNKRPGGKGKKGQGGKPGDRGKFANTQRKPRPAKKADPNSPFAVLADLKSQLMNPPNDSEKS